MVRYLKGNMAQVGKTATETHEMLVQVYGTKAVSRKCVYDWFKCFRDGKETSEDEPCSGRPTRTWLILTCFLPIAKAFKPVVNTFSAHGFRPVHLHQHFMRLRRRFP